MKTKEIDTVMAEMHAIKDANSARFGHDLKRMFFHWSELQKGPVAIATAPVRKRQGKTRPAAAKGRGRATKKSTHA